MLLLLSLACAPKGEEATPTFDEMNIAAIVDFHGDGAEPAVLGLRDWLVEHASDWEATDWPGGYTLGAVDEDDFASIPHSENVDWAQVLGVGTPLRVRGTVDGYAEAAVEADQSFAHASYDVWDRRIVGGSAEGFLAGGEMQTDNTIEKTDLGVTIPYSANKDYRWFGDVLAAITWVPEEGWGPDGVNGILCGFTIELWYEEDGEVRWYNGQWTQVATIFGADMPEDVLIDQFIDGTVDYMEGTEAFVMGEYTGE
ncbi:MAG: hypothetical protein ACK4YP_09965 [Myxococcota bacterium]